MSAISIVSVPLPTATFLEVASFLKASGSDRDPVQAIEDAVAYWLENAAWKAEDLMPEAVVEDDARGYTWKHGQNSVFLPHTSLMRMKHQGAFAYAKVEGDDLVYNGESLSPNQFALRVTGGSARDAWREMWIRRPGDEDYVHADSLRHKKD